MIDDCHLSHGEAMPTSLSPTIPMIKRSHILAIGLGAASTLTACDQNVDLASVRALSAQVAAAEPSYAAIADDLYQSCHRIVGWEMTGKFHLALTPSGAASSLVKNKPPTSKPDALSAAEASPAAITSDLLASYKCDDAIKAASQQWQAANAILTSYFDALGTAAGDDSKVDFGFKQLATAAGNAGILTPSNGQTSATAASDLARAIFAARRRSLTADQATAAKNAVSFYVGRLSTVADEYAAMLDTEKGEINSFYSQNFVAQNIGLQTLETIRYRTDWKNALDDLNVRYTAKTAYVNSLASLQEGNDKIADAAAKNDFASVYAVVGVIVSELKPDVLAMQKAFK